VVASSVGGVGESLRDEENGYLVPRGDVEALRDRIERLVTSSDLRVRMGANGRARYEQDFTLSHGVARTLAVYQNVLDE
jgi:glycosyltransferase involved in cell wall biosynthesis